LRQAASYSFHACHDWVYYGKKNNAVKEQKSMDGGIIAGIVICCVAAGLFVMWVVKWYRDRQHQDMSEFRVLSSEHEKEQEKERGIVQEQKEWNAQGFYFGDERH